MSDEQRTDEPSEDEREATFSDLDVPEEDAEELKGGREGTIEAHKI